MSDKILSKMERIEDLPDWFDKNGNSVTAQASRNLWEQYWWYLKQQYFDLNFYKMTLKEFWEVLKNLFLSLVWFISFITFPISGFIIAFLIRNQNRKEYNYEHPNTFKKVLFIYVLNKNRR